MLTPKSGCKPQVSVGLYNVWKAVQFENVVIEILSDCFRSSL